MSTQVRPGYKLTEVGVIPEDWDVTTIGQVVNDFRGGAPLKPSEFTSTGVRVLPKGGVGYGGLLRVAEDEWQFCSQLYADEHINNQVDNNYTIIVLRDLVPSGPSIGLAVRISDSNSYVLAQGVYGFKVSPQKLEQGYIIQLSNTSPYRKLMNSIMVGSTQVHITNTAYKLAPIPLPPLPEQRAIAAALSDMDALISGLDQLIVKKRDIKQAALQQLLTGQQRLPGFSGEWEMKRLGDIAEIRDGTHQTPRYVESGIPFYSVENVTSGDFVNTKFISEDEHRLLTKSFRIEQGDILMTRIGSIGDCKLVDWDVDASFYVSLALLKIRNGYLPEFIFHYSRSSLFKKEIELNTLQSAIPKKINLGPISHVRMIIPTDPAEQTAIATILSGMDSELATLETRRDKARQLKQGMMQELLTGRIRLSQSSQETKLCESQLA